MKQKKKVGRPRKRKQTVTAKDVLLAFLTEGEASVRKAFTEGLISRPTLRNASQMHGPIAKAFAAEIAPRRRRRLGALEALTGFKRGDTLTVRVVKGPRGYLMEVIAVNAKREDDPPEHVPPQLPPRSAHHN